jgi:hypothetical protein
VSDPRDFLPLLRIQRSREISIYLAPRLDDVPREVWSRCAECGESVSMIRGDVPEESQIYCRECFDATGGGLRARRKP